MKFIALACLLAFSNADLVKRIFGGIRAPVLGYPGLAVLTVCLALPGPCKPICGAIIYSKKWVSSTGSCTWKIDQIYPKRFVFVQVGKWNMKNLEPSNQIFGIEYVYTHNYYNNDHEGIREYDIGLIKLCTSIHYNQVVHKFPLKEEIHNPELIIFMVGWGVIGLNAEDKEIWPNILRFARVKLISTDECDNHFRTLFQSNNTMTNGNIINDRMICTGPVLEETSACQGDFGGPLIQYEDEYNPRIIGLISYAAEPCGHTNTHTVHTKISEYLGWINGTISNHELLYPE